MYKNKGYYLVICNICKKITYFKIIKIFIISLNGYISLYNKDYGLEDPLEALLGAVAYIPDSLMPSSFKNFETFLVRRFGITSSPTCNLA